MKSASHQVQDLAGIRRTTFDLKVKCLLVAIYENDRKTVLQPLVTAQEAQAVPELFQNKILEVWLSNGETDIAQFDVAILEYKQVLKTLTKCKKVKTQMCLKNHFENIASCEQCPLSINAEEILDDDT